MNDKNIDATDKDLVDRALRGDQHAFRQLFEKYWTDLYRLACRRIASEEDVKDILQEVFLSLWNNLHQITINNNIGGYLYMSLRNKIFNYYDKKQVRLRTLMNRPFYPAETEASVYSSISTKELREHLATILNDMPEKMREIYELSKVHQMTNAEIAAMLMISSQTIKNQLYRAVSRLREGLKDYHSCILFLLFL